MYHAEIIKDSVVESGTRLTSMIWTLPRIVLAELNTHRMKSSNASSSRAIPVEKIINQVRENPYIPDKFPLNAKGMQPQEYVTEESNPKLYQEMVDEHLIARDNAVRQAEFMRNHLNVHKQICNRYLEPWMWTTVVISATEWNNIWGLRYHPAAQREFQQVVKRARAEYVNHTPQELAPGSWHLPFIDDKTYDEIGKITHQKVIEALIKQGIPPERAAEAYPAVRHEEFILQDISVGRCAKVSYLNHGTGKREPVEDIRLAVQLSMNVPGHWSPFEHVARPLVEQDDHLEVIKQGEVVACFSGNFRDFFQYRKMFSNENIEEFSEEGIILD